MAIEIKAPALPESVPDGTISTWYKNVGDMVKMDELLVDIETDKVVIEVASPINGTLREILKVSGEVIVSNEIIGHVEQSSLSKNNNTGVTDSDLGSETTIEKMQEFKTKQVTSTAAKKLIEEGVITSEELNKMKAKFKNLLEEQFKTAKEYKHKLEWYEGV